MSTDEVDNTNEVNDENASKDRKNSRRQRQQLRFVEDEPEDKEPKSPSTFKPPTRASRFLSICEPSIELPKVDLFRLRQLHNQTVDEKDSTELTNEEFDKIPFKYE